MSTQTLPEFGERAISIRQPQALTSTWLWWSLAAVVTTIDALRVPAIVDRIRSDVPAHLVDEVGDPAILDIALNVGAYVSLTLVLMVVGLCALIGKFLETRVFPHAKSMGPVRVGLVFCATTVVMLWSRALAVWEVSSTARLIALAVLVVVAAGVGAWTFAPAPLQLRVWLRGAALAAVVGVVPCVQ